MGLHPRFEKWARGRRNALSSCCREKTMNRLIAYACVFACTALPATAQERRPTHANVTYGPHARNVMDVWLKR